MDGAEDPRMQRHETADLNTGSRVLQGYCGAPRAAGSGDALMTCHLGERAAEAAYVQGTPYTYRIN